MDVKKLNENKKKQQINRVDLTTFLKVISYNSNQPYESDWSKYCTKP